MTTAVKYHTAIETMVEGMNLGSDTYKVVLTNRAPVVATDADIATVSEIAAGNGYTAGGNAAAVSSSAQASGTYKLVLADPATWTAAGGTIGPFRYAVLVNVTQDKPVQYYDYGSSITLAVGESFQVDFDATNGALQVA
jgi:hypothetical protein